MAPDVSTEECFRLARAMTLKNAAADWVNGVEPDDDVTFVVIKIR